METTVGWCAEREIRRRLPRTEEKSNRVALPDTMLLGRRLTSIEQENLQRPSHGLWPEKANLFAG